MPEQVLAAPELWVWLVLPPSLLALILLLRRGLVPEGPELPPGRWGILAVLAVVLVHLVAWEALGGILRMPFLPTGLAIGILVVAIDAVTVAAVLAAAFLHGSPEALGLRTPRIPRNAAVVVLSVMAFVSPLEAVNSLWVQLLDRLGLEPVLQPVLEVYVRAEARGEWWEVGAIAVGAVVAAPIMEEVLFRGFIYGGLQGRIGPRAAAWATSAAFAVFHLQLTVLLPIFLVGMALQWVHTRTGCIAYPILFHALFNGINLLGVSLG